MDALAYDLKRMVEHNKDGSYATQAGRHDVLQMAARDLKALGFKLPSARSFKPKHIEGLLAKWRGDGVSDGTLKNRMSYLRWAAACVGKASIIPRDNDELGIAQRKRGKASRAQLLDMDKLATIECPYIRMNLRLMAAFGLRQKEAMLMRPHEASLGGMLHVNKGTKGGRPRLVPILTMRQAELVAEAVALAAGGSLIPVETYIQHKKAFEYQTLKAGFTKLHGLRHQYAQARFKALAGFACPLAGGELRAQLSAAEKEKDREARQIIAEELGHGRHEVTRAYLG